MNGKKKRNRHLFGKARDEKVGEVFSNDAFLIISFHWPSFYFSGIGVDVCKKDYTRKKRENDLGPSTSTVNRDGKVDNSGIGTNIADKDGEINNRGTKTDTTNIDRKSNNLKTGTNMAKTNRRVDDQDTSTNKIETDKKADNSNISINIIDANVDRGADLGIIIDIINLNANANKRVDNPCTRKTDVSWQLAASNKAGMSLFSLHKVLFFISSSKLGTIFAFLSSSFVFSLFQIILMKKKLFSLSTDWSNCTCPLTIKSYHQ